MRQHRQMVFVTGANGSGKSRLGQILAPYRDCLYLLATPSPKDYFSPNGALLSPAKATADRLRRYVVFLCYLMGGGSHHGQRWLGTNHLFHYDFDRLAREIEPQIHSGIRMPDFYATLDQSLCVARKRGSYSKFTVFEVEGLDDIRYANTLMELPSVRILMVLRDPVNTLASQKISALVRGSNDDSMFPGALSIPNSVYLLYLKELQTQYDNYRRFSDYFPLITRQGARNTSNAITPLGLAVHFDDLKSLNACQSDAIAAYIFKNAPQDRKDLATFLRRISKPGATLKNDYLHLQPDGQSYYNPIRQQHLPGQITKRNQRHLFWWERRLAALYRPVFDRFVLKRNVNLALWKAILQFPVLLACAGLLDPREVRTDQRLSHRLLRRYNGLKWTVESGRWLLKNYVSRF